MPLASMPTTPSTRTTWHQLIPGLAASVVTVLAALAIIMFARVGELHGKTAVVHAAIDAARGVLRGTEVWLDGEKIGMVKSVGFQAPRVDQRYRVVLTMEVLTEYLTHLRLDSPVHIQSGGTIIGAQIVSIGEGTRRARALRDGDTLLAQPQGDLEGATSQFAIASRQFPAIIANIKLLAAELQSTRGTLGAFGMEHGGHAMSAVNASASRLMAKVNGTHGTLGQLLSSRGALTVEARTLVASADSIVRLLGSKRTSMGRFQRDSTLPRQIAALQARMSAVSSRARSPDGTLGRFGADSAVFQSLAQTQAEIGALLADVQRRPLRYLRF